MLQESDGWQVINIRDARWYDSDEFGKVCSFEDPKNPFPQTGVRINLLEPGKPNCRYHREGAQEDFLVLSGCCRLLINGQEKQLKAWDYVHCPPGVSHVFVGDGDKPCAILMIGHRPETHKLYYPENELARKYGAASPEPTDNPHVAYADVTPRREITAPEWPL